LSATKPCDSSSPFYGSNDKLSIVDRAKLPQILHEIGLEQTGIMDLGENTTTLKLVGVTHMLIVDGNKRGITNCLTGRFVDVETGKVLAVDEVMD
jgi:hypothetical protein